jgi:hypothetical protein
MLVHVTCAERAESEKQTKEETRSVGMVLLATKIVASVHLLAGDSDDSDDADADHDVEAQRQQDTQPTENAQ